VCPWAPSHYNNDDAGCPRKSFPRTVFASGEVPESPTARHANPTNPLGVGDIRRIGTFAVVFITRLKACTQIAEQEIEWQALRRHNLRICWLQAIRISENMFKTILITETIMNHSTHRSVSALPGRRHDWSAEAPRQSTCSSTRSRPTAAPAHPPYCTPIGSPKSEPCPRD